MAKTGALNWKKGRSPETIIAELNDARKQESGSVSYTNMWLEFYESTLLSALQIKRPLSKDIVLRLLRGVIREPTTNGKLSVPQVLNSLSHAAKRHLRRRQNTYYLVTSLSYRGNPPIAWASANNCRLYFRYKPDKFYRGDRSRSILASKLENLGLTKQRQSYKVVVARVDARSKDEAFDLAITAIDEVRGLMNFALNRRTGFRWSSGQRQPVNSLRLGPIHTLHDLTGALATEFFCMSPSLLSLQRWQI